MSYWKHARVYLVALLAFLCLIGCGENTAESIKPSPEEIKRVVVIHFDTTRIDDIGCYGGIPRTPYVDDLAARGMRYTNSIAPLTVSIRTGRPSCVRVITKS